MPRPCMRPPNSQSLMPNKALQPVVAVRGLSSPPIHREERDVSRKSASLTAQNWIFPLTWNFSLTPSHQRAVANALGDMIRLQDLRLDTCGRIPGRTAKSHGSNLSGEEHEHASGVDAAANSESESQTVPPLSVATGTITPPQAIHERPLEPLSVCDGPSDQGCCSMPLGQPEPKARFNFLNSLAASISP